MPSYFNNPRSVAIDMYFLFFVSIEVAEIPQKIRKSLDKREWLTIISTPFLEGYVSQFPADEQLQVLAEIQKQLRDSIPSYYQTIYDKYKDLLDLQINKLEMKLLRKNKSVAKNQST
jgi:hypothetical protein